MIKTYWQIKKNYLQTNSEEFCPTQVLSTQVFNHYSLLSKLQQPFSCPKTVFFVQGVQEWENLTTPFGPCHTVAIWTVKMAFPWRHCSTTVIGLEKQGMQAAVAQVTMMAVSGVVFASQTRQNLLFIILGSRHWCWSRSNPPFIVWSWLQCYCLPFVYFHGISSCISSSMLLLIWRASWAADSAGGLFFSLSPL